jgi:hypothetical protein
MKMNKKYTFVILLLSVVLFSCQPEEKEVPTPADPRDNFEGSWTCAETSKQNGNSTFTVHIVKSTNNSSQVVLENFYNYGFNKTLNADISGSSITIASQLFSGTNRVSGNGTLSGSKINMNYVVDDGAGTAAAYDTCKAVLTK